MAAGLDSPGPTQPRHATNADGSVVVGEAAPRCTELSEGLANWIGLGDLPGGPFVITARAVRLRLRRHLELRGRSVSEAFILDRVRDASPASVLTQHWLVPDGWRLVSGALKPMYTFAGHGSIAGTLEA